MPFAFLLAMQASGMVVDYLGIHAQQQFMKYGQKVDEAGMEANLDLIKLQTEDESLQAMKALRQNLGTQIAVQAARGTSTSAGSAVSFLTDSLSTFYNDERIRRMNALGKENQLRGQRAISQLQSSSDVSKLWQGFASRNLNRLSTLKSAYGTKPSGGFGLTGS